MSPELIGVFVLILIAAGICKILFDKRCQNCGLTISRQAKICPHCKNQLSD
jgi:hypothetical protein